MLVPVICEVMQQKNNYTVSQKKQDTIYLSVTSPNVNRDSLSKLVP